MFSRQLSLLNLGEAAVGYELSDGESINIMRPLYISFCTSFPMLTTASKALTEKGSLSVKTVRMNREWSNDSSNTKLS